MNTDWPGTDYGERLIPEDYKLAVPLTLLYLTPPAVAFIGWLLLLTKLLLVLTNTYFTLNTVSITTRLFI